MTRPFFRLMLSPRRAAINLVAGRCRSAYPSGMRSLCRALLITVTVLAAAGVAPPQDAIVFTRLGVDLWPDYDRPGVLVIYRGSIAPGATLPARVQLRIPAAAGDPTALAERSPDGQLVNLTFDRRTQGDMAVIDATVTRPDLQMEYYDPAIEHDGATHSFTFSWPGDYAVGELNVTVQQPDLAQDLTTVPPAATRAPGGDGLLYHTVVLPAVPAGEAVDVQVTYEKVADQLSVETIPAPATSTSSPAPAAGAPSSEREMVIVVAVVLASAVLAGLALLLGRRRRGEPSPEAAGGAAAPSGAARFCTQCGAAAGSADRFCHQCGTAVR